MRPTNDSNDSQDSQDSKGWVLVAETATVTCPGCGGRVSAQPDASAVACPNCATAFSPWGMPTAVRATDPGTPRDGSAPGRGVAGPTGAPDPLVGTHLAGWRLLRVIGRGGMGTVYEASRDDDPARGRVAVKVLPEDLARDPAFVSRFRREAKVQSGLSHPHIVEVFERGEEGGRCYFVMEHVRGESLRRLLERGPLPWRDAARIATEVLVGLGYAHGRGVVHRDLKPENVLLGDDGRVRLVDFGLSRIVRGEAALSATRLTSTDVILGTYEYMAPEQRTGAADVDERADLYALGVMLYEGLTGSLPLGRFEPASRLRPGVPPSFDAVIHRALSTKPSDRFPSAVAFQEALAEAVASAGSSAATAGAGVPPAAPLAVGPSTPSRAARLAAARGVLKHVELLATGDRVLGVLMVLAFFGLATATGVRLRGWIVPFAGVSSIVALVAGVLYLKQGARLRRMDPGAREAQITASIFALVIFPPFGTALGIYGLVVMMTDAARDAFAIGREGLPYPSTIVPLPPASPPHVHRRRAPPGRRRGAFGAFVRSAILAGALGALAVALVDPKRDADITSTFAFTFAGVFCLSIGAWWATRGRRDRRHDRAVDAGPAPAATQTGPRPLGSAWPGFLVYFAVLGVYLGGLISMHAGDSGQSNDTVAHWIFTTIPLWMAASLLGGWVWRRFGAGASAVLLVVLMVVAWAATESADPKGPRPWPPVPHGNALTPPR